MSGLLQRFSAAAEKRPRLALALALLAGATVALALQSRGPPRQALRLTPVVESVLRDRGTPRAGAASPEVIVVVFTDYRCPICRKTDPALERLIAADPTVRVHFKDWPILGEASRVGARAALAADRQGKYVAMHRVLMTARGPITPQTLPQFAHEAGLDGARLAQDMAQHGAEIDEQLARHAAQAFAMGLQGTPAYLVGPYLIQGGLDERQLRRAVAAARRAGPPKPVQPE